MVEKIVNREIADYWDKRGETYVISWKSAAKKRLSELEIGLVRGAIESVRERSGGKRMRTLDIGIGLGRISEAVMEYAVEHCGIDVSRTMLDYCREKFKDNKKLERLVLCDILNPLPEDMGKFDVVTAIRVLSYTPLWRKELENIYDAMNPGGVCVFTFPNRYSSILLPRLRAAAHGKYAGPAVTYRELETAVRGIGFSECRIRGFTRLLDVLYDWCDSEVSAGNLFGIENFLETILGPTLFARLYYVICKK